MDVAGMSLEIGGEEGLRLEFTFGSQTRSQRIGTGATPARYQSAVPLAISTRRLVRPYQTPDAVALPEDFAGSRLRPIPNTDRFELFYWSNVKDCWTTSGNMEAHETHARKRS